MLKLVGDEGNCGGLSLMEHGRVCRYLVVEVCAFGLDGTTVVGGMCGVNGWIDGGEKHYVCTLRPRSFSSECKHFFHGGRLMNGGNGGEGSWELNMSLLFTGIVEKNDD